MINDQANLRNDNSWYISQKFKGMGCLVPSTNKLEDEINRHTPYIYE